jgi:hypothetical protein
LAIGVILAATLVFAFFVIHNQQIPYTGCPEVSNVPCDPPGAFFDRRLELRVAVLALGLVLSWGVHRMGRRGQDQRPWTEE